MATGDDATARGWDIVPGTADRRDGWDEINKSRDYAAQAHNAADAAATAVTAKADANHTHAAEDVELASGTSLQLYASVTNDRLDDLEGTGSKADGPTSTAYSRSATGSSWYAVWMNSALQFMRNTSSRRYKTAEKPLDLDPRLILQLQPTTYHRKGQPRGARELGLIAEDVAALGVPHLVSWDVERDANGDPVEGAVERPEAVRYEQVLPVLLLHVLRAQQAELDGLRARLDTNEERN